MKLRHTKIVAFKTLAISQGSVPTHLRCSGIFIQLLLIARWVKLFVVHNS